MLRKLEKEFGNTLNANAVDNVLKIIADELDSYEVESIDDAVTDISSNDMLEAYLTAK